jgi:putative ABC transport system permease protein
MPRLLTYALRSLWARRMTTLATAGGIALLVFVLSASGMLSNGMRQTLRSAAAPDRAIVMEHDSWAEPLSRVAQSVVSKVAAAPGVKLDEKGQPLVTGETVTHLIIGDATDSRISTVQIRGVDANVLSLRPSVHIVQGRAIQPNTAEAMVGRGVLGRQKGLVLGGSFELSPARPVTVVGVFESGGSVLDSEVWTDLTVARTSFGMDGYVSSITATLTHPDQFDGFSLALTEDKQDGLDAAREMAYYTKISNGIARVIQALGVAEAVIFSLGAVCATMIVFYGAVAQRRREVGVLRALGFGPLSILTAFLAESIVLSLAGGAIGVALAMLTPFLDFNSVNFATGQDVSFHFQPALDTLLIAVGVSALVGVLGGIAPAIRAARMHPVMAMRA